MSPDWSEMHRLEGQGFLSNTEKPGETWTSRYILPEDQPMVDAAIAEAIENKAMFELEHRVRRADGTAGWIFSRALPLKDASGEVVEWLGAASDVTERRRAADALKRSEERARLLASIVESSADAIISKNLESIILSWNEGAERLFGYAAAEVIGKPVTILMPLDRHDEESAILERIRRGERIEHYETVRQRKDGSLLDVSLTVSPVRDAEGRIVGASKIARDITDRTRADKLVATLAREAEHRTKNVLSTVMATVHLSNAETADELKSVIEGRLRALAGVHALFVESRWAGADVHTIVTQELAPYARSGEGRASFEGPSLLVKPETAQALAVTLHELATNAAKYGALSRSSGRVRVGWSPTAGGRLLLEWTEAGGPPVRLPSHEGFGMRVMRNMIAGQDGTLELAWHPEGLACTITLPA